MSVVCFGEVLWDMLPAGRQPGGAPFNVAVHLHQLGLSANLISSVGPDELGRELLSFIEAKSLRTDFVEQASHPTSVVQAMPNEDHEVTYTIVQPVAWDYIRYTATLERLVAAANIFVFGSLAARQLVTRQTLYRLLEHARLKVFDVNLRPPHYSRAVVEHLLGQADIVKMNEHELTEIMGWSESSATPPTAAMRWLAERFQLQAVCVTCGADGALLWTNGQLYRAPGVPVIVQDTVGSGDAFLAAFLQGWQAGQEPSALLRFACATGALVAMHHGATPTLTPDAIAALLVPKQP